MWCAHGLRGKPAGYCVALQASAGAMSAQAAFVPFFPASPAQAQVVLLSYRAKRPRGDVHPKENRLQGGEGFGAWIWASSGSSLKDSEVKSAE